ncbi:MAG: DedA family protein [Pseudomonadota bacterium]
MSYVDLFLNYLYSLPDGMIYLLLGVSAFVENVFPPIPGDTITVFGAFLVGIGKLDFFWVFLSTTIGSLAGFMCLFCIGRYLGRTFFINKNYRFFKARDILRAEEWFGRHGYILIALNRFLPGVRSAISLAGGITRLKSLRVMLFALLSCGTWNMIWILLGYVLGTHWEIVRSRTSDIMMKYNIGVFILFGIVIILFILKRKYRKRP